MVLLEDVKNIRPEYKIYCDLDGVLADFAKGVKDILKLEHDEEKYEADPQYRKKMWKAVDDYTKSGGRLWQELDLMPDAMVLWKYIIRYSNTEILTATGDSKYDACKQKNVWVPKHLGNVEINCVRAAVEKSQFAADNHILIDDKEKAIKPWIAAGGIGILHTSADNTIKKLKKLGL